MDGMGRVKSGESRVKSQKDELPVCCLALDSRLLTLDFKPSVVTVIPTVYY